MAKISVTRFLFYLVLISNIVFAYDRLWIEDPQRPWRDGQGTIEEAVISVRPQGLYMEIGLYLTFSARGLNFDASDQLEVQYRFDLPENAIVHDLWLWVGDDIMRAKILDRWTASEIYEDIVDRRRDPAILFKRNTRRHDLKVYPMFGNETRKVKLTYLVPAQWFAESVTAALPTNLLRASEYPVEVFKLLYWPTEGWQNPRIVEFPDIPFSVVENDAQGDFLRADIPREAIEANLHLAVDSPLNNGLYVNAMDIGGEGYYQMAYLPSEVLDHSINGKVAFLFDYDATKSTLTPQEVITSFKSTLRQHFTASDSFNIIFSNLNIIRAGERWFAGDSAGIDAAFASVGNNPMADYSNLPALLLNGINFIKNHGNMGSLMLISNSDNVGNYTVANSLIDDVMSEMNPAFPIHVADFLDRNVRTYQFGGRSYRGNEYFYENIARMTNGHFQTAAGSAYSDHLSQLFETLSGFLSSFDLHTTLANGFCFGRFNLGNNTQQVYLDRPILQVGKYYGAFPFVVEASGVYNGDPFFNTIEIANNTAGASDSLIRKMWAGNHIQNLETGDNSDDAINEIVYQSIQERVLSLYTAFLALEPNDSTVFACEDCFDETGLVGIEDTGTLAEDDSLFLAYPNPFNAETIIKIKLPARFQTGNEALAFRIFNIRGQLIRRFDSPTNANREYQFTWKGLDDGGSTVASGTYFFVVSNGSMRQVLKLLMVK